MIFTYQGKILLNLSANSRVGKIKTKDQQYMNSMIMSSVIALVRISIATHVAGFLYASDPELPMTEGFALIFPT